jgi:AraC-like DNA-binding protein
MVQRKNPRARRAASEDSGVRIRPVNDEQVCQELFERTRKHGSIQKLADKLGMAACHLRSQVSGNESLHPRVAAALGYELKWVKKQG